MLRLLTLLLSCVAVCAQPVLSLNDPTVVAKSSSLLQGLVGYWQLEEASGTRYDRSPYGNHLTSNNSVGQGTGKVGNCAKFTSSSSQFLSITDKDSLSTPGTSFTISAWVNANSIGTGPRIVSKRSLVTNADYDLRYDTLSNRFAVSILDASGNEVVVLANNYGALSTNVWAFVAAGFNLSLKSMFISVNGGTLDTQSTTNQVPVDSTATFEIGNLAQVNRFWDGFIDEVGFWKRALSTTEITQLYRSGLGVTYPRFSMRDNRADDFNWDTWEPLYDKPKTLIAFVNRREPEPLLTICE